MKIQEITMNGRGAVRINQSGIYTKNNLDSMVSTWEKQGWMVAVEQNGINSRLDDRSSYSIERVKIDKQSVLSSYKVIN